MALKIVSGRGKSDLQDELDRLREREALKTDLIRLAAHGLRNPLALVMGYTEILSTEGGDLTDEQRIFLDGIQTASARMYRIIETVLSLERVEELENNAANQVIELAALVRDVLVEAKQDADRAGVEVEYNLIDLTVRGDRVQLFEALANVIGNAIKYTRDNGKVTVSMEQKSGLARVVVVDNGMGIPAEEQKRIFEPFFRARDAAETVTDGVGLGLYLGQRVVERHGGRILLESRHGEGSTFVIELPLG
jgi:signal transduction histidine kinase